MLTIGKPLLDELSEREIASFPYQLDNVDNRTFLTENAGVTTYTYDDRSHLTQSNYQVATANYQYDPVSNRLIAQ